MAIIYCPQCDSEIPDNETICPSCGFNLDEYDESETDKEFNALLNAANKKLSEEAEEAEEEEEEAHEETASGGAISQSQIDALLGGNVVDLGGGEKKKKPKKKKAKKPAPVREKKPQEAIEEPAAAVVSEKPADTPKAADTETAGEVNESAETAETAQVKEIPAVNGKAPVRNVVKKEKKEKTGGASPVVTIAAAVVAAALGFCVALLLFGDLFRTPEEAFAIRAANAVNSQLTVNEQLCVYKAYVKLGAASDECIIYAIKDYKDVVSASKYRVVVSKYNGNVVNVYYTIDENSAEYLAMKNSEDPEVRVQASVLKNYSDSIENAHREISIGTPSWVSVDISEINSNITSAQLKETKD